MSHKNTTNDDDYQYHNMVIGDILLHSEMRTTPIQVIVQTFTAKSSDEFDKMNIPRRGITNNQTKISCDLENSTQEKLKHGRSLPSKKIIRMHKAGWTLIKELKSKVITINNSDSKISTDLSDEQTQF